VPRKAANSVTADGAAVARRVRQFFDDGTLTSIDGMKVPVRARSILVHRDTPGAVGLAQIVRHEIEAGGGQIVPAARLAA